MNLFVYNSPYISKSQQYNSYVAFLMTYFPLTQGLLPSVD